MLARVLQLPSSLRCTYKKEEEEEKKALRAVAARHEYDRRMAITPQNSGRSTFLPSKTLPLLLLRYVCTGTTTTTTRQCVYNIYKHDGEWGNTILYRDIE